MFQVFIGADHGGENLKNAIIKHLEGKKDSVKVRDVSKSEQDYPTQADVVAENVLQNTSAYGVLICGSGIGISIRANRHEGVRAGLVHDEYTAEMSRKHNDANIICFGERVIDAELAKKCLDIFLSTEFEGGRHIPRLAKLDLAT